MHGVVGFPFLDPPSADKGPGASRLSASRFEFEKSHGEGIAQESIRNNGRHKPLTAVRPLYKPDFWPSSGHWYLCG